MSLSLYNDTVAHLIYYTEMNRKFRITHSDMLHLDVHGTCQEVDELLFWSRIAILTSGTPQRFCERTM
jgi:hypothetical protein